MLRCGPAPIAALPLPERASQQSEAPVRALPSRRGLLQTSLQSLFCWSACAAYNTRPAQARVLDVQKGGPGERDVIVLSSGNIPYLLMVSDTRIGALVLT